jgi:hypothetical protein
LSFGKWIDFLTQNWDNWVEEKMNEKIVKALSERLSSQKRQGLEYG